MPKRDDIADYQIARFAEWAGDAAHSRSLYANFASNDRFEMFPEKFDYPTDVIAFVSRLRATHLGEGAPESTVMMARSVLGEYAEYQKGLPKPFVLRPTPHLRGVVHRTGIRDFEMRAYLTDLEYEETLYRRAQTTRTKAGNQPDPREVDADVRYRGAGASWVIEGVLFQQVMVTDFGLVRSIGIWTRGTVPTDAKDVTNEYQSLLELLDPSSVDKQ